MKAKEIIKIACDFVGKPDLAAAIEDGNLSGQNKRAADKLLNCLNLVQNEVATEFVPLFEVEEFKPSESKILYSQFKKPPICIVWVKDRLGRNQNFKAQSGHIVIFSSYAKIKYQFEPDVISSLEDEMEQQLLPMRIYAYGVAREYYLSQDLGDEADIWEGRFKDSLSIFVRKKREVKMPCRRWL